MEDPLIRNIIKRLGRIMNETHIEKKTTHLTFGKMKNIGLENNVQGQDTVSPLPTQQHENRLRDGDDTVPNHE